MKNSRLHKIAAALALASLCCAVSARTATATMQVTATVTESCTLAANPLSFGTFTNLPSSVDADSSIIVNCASGVAYSAVMSVGTGANVGADIFRRLLLTGNFGLDYNVYTDPARTIPVGNGNAGTALTGVGNGAPQSIGVFGRIFPRPTTPTPGNYTDALVVTLTF